VQKIARIGSVEHLPALLSREVFREMPPALQPGPLNHVALPTADPERGARFYCDVLGFVETPRPSFSFRGSWLLRRDVGVMIHLIHDKAHEARPKPPLSSRTNHLAMQVKNFDAAVEQLAAHGVAHEVRVLPDYNYRQVFFQDPDGNVLELGEWPSPAEMFPELQRKTD
jgi:catechol 2,3-dioxygenase-like lactoylglutathione lyase family enzyme